MMFKPVYEFPDLYRVSDHGDVERSGFRTNTSGGRFLSPKTAKGGYRQVALWQGGKPHWRMVHRLVWEAFNERRIPVGMQVNHLNGISSDNRIENLEVCTASENAMHSYRFLGKKPPNAPSFGTRNGSAKLNSESVARIRQLYFVDGWVQQKIAEQFGVSQRLVSLITRNELWCEPR